MGKHMALVRQQRQKQLQEVSGVFITTRILASFRQALRVHCVQVDMPLRTFVAQALTEKLAQEAP